MEPNEKDPLMNEVKINLQEIENIDAVIQTDEQFSDLDEEIESFESLSVNELVDRLSSVWDKNHVKEFKKQFYTIKKRFGEIWDEEKLILLNQFTEEGGDAKDFYFTPENNLIELKDWVKKFSEKINEIRKKEEQELQANLLAKQDIVHELRLIISEESDIKKAFEKFNALREKWTSIGMVPQNYADDLWKNYKFLSDKFYEFVQINRELYEVEMKKNQEAKQQLIKRAEALLELPSVKRSVEMIHLLQKEWRETGPVSKEISKEIFDRFKELVQKIYERRDEFVKSRDEQRKQNLSVKKELCDQLDQLNSVDYKTLQQWRSAEAELKNIEEKWKKTGRVPSQVNDEIWERFKDAKRSFFKKRQSLLKQIQSEWTGNYQRKIQLCEKAEALKDNTDWKNTTQQLIQLQNEWKKIGPVERKKSDEIWTRFRNACDTFFQAKENYSASQGDREIENLNLKKQLIESVNNFQTKESIEENLEFIRSKQTEWSAIGFVPMKDKKLIEAEFDQAISKILQQLNIDKDKLFRIEYKIRIENMMQAQNAEAQLKEERTMVSMRARKLEEEINQLENNLMFFKYSKDADNIKKQYEEKILSLKKDLSQFDEKKQMIKNAFQKLGK